MRHFCGVSSVYLYVNPEGWVWLPGVYGKPLYPLSISPALHSHLEAYLIPVQWTTQIQLIEESGKSSSSVAGESEVVRLLVNFLTSQA